MICKAEQRIIDEGDKHTPPLIRALPKCTCFQDMSGGCFANCDRRTLKTFSDKYNVFNGKITTK